MTAIELINASLRLIGVKSTGIAISGPEAADGLEALQLLLDAWSGQGLLIYARTSESFSLTSATSYTIGTGGTFNTSRPVEILGAYVTSGGMDYPIKLIAANTYRDIAQKTLSGTPDWLYYSPEYPLGKIYIAPTGSGTTLHIESLKVLTEPTTLVTSLVFPPGYERALKYNLAIDLAPEYGRQVDQSIVERAISDLTHIKQKNAADRVDEVKLEILQLSRRWSIDGG